MALCILEYKYMDLTAFFISFFSIISRSNDINQFYGNSNNLPIYELVAKECQEWIAR